MTNPNYENHMVLEQDKADRVLTTAEIKLEEQKQVALDAEKNELADYIIDGDDLSEVIAGRAREKWFEFADDLFVEPANVLNLLNSYRSNDSKLDTLNEIRDLTKTFIIREMEK